MSKRKTISIIATLDTKGEEVRYLKEQIEERGKDVIIVDSGIRGAPKAVKPDIPRETVAQEAGSSIEVLQKLDRGPAVDVMMKGVANIAKKLYIAGKMDGVISIGGLDGALLATAGMKVLPIGIPKLMVTPIAQGKHTFDPFVGTKDVMMMHTVVDVVGINELTKKIFDNAVAAIVGMVDADVGAEIRGKNLIAIPMYGNTTPVVMRSKSLLEERGYEIILFHPNGTGGRAMEELIEQGIFTAVLDMTTHEITDDLFGGDHTAGPHRLEAAGKKGVPQVVVPGCIDFIIRILPVSEVERIYEGRKLYYFNPTVTLVRTNKEEMEVIGRTMADKLNKAVGPVVVVVPLRGMSMYNVKGGALYDPEADEAFLTSLKNNIDPRIEVVEVDAHINDPIFADICVSNLLDMLEKK
ncbi:MAG: Tm-1-like ATP-binding domain-containing protein [Candidatus Geothermarchaeales archaeon]